MNTIFKYVDLFISKKTLSNPEKQQTARYFALLLLFIFIMMSFYNVIYEVVDQHNYIKRTANVLSLFFIVFSLLILKFLDRPNLAITSFALCCLGLTVTSCYLSGGIFSYEIGWFAIYIISSIVIIGIREGLIMFALSIIILTWFYIAYILGVRDFQSERVTIPEYTLLNHVLMIICTCLIGVFTISRNQKLRQMVEKEREKQIRKELANDFHDDLGNKLAVITSTSSLLTDLVKTENKTKLITLSKRIENHSLDVYQSFRDLIWTINTHKDSITDLYEYITEIGHQTFMETKTYFHSKSSTSPLTYESLSTIEKRNIIFIAKEIMTNSLKYANASDFYFEFNSKSANGITLIFEDNGIGFEEKKVSKNNGIYNIKERVHLLKGYINIDSILDKGTRINIVIPHDKN